MARTQPIFILILVSALAVTLPSGLWSEAETKLAHVRAEPLAVDDSSPIWEGRQFLQADKQGRVFLLNADTLEVFQITTNGKLSLREELKPLADHEASRLVHQAVMSPSGDVWVLLQPGNRVRRFEGRKEKPLPAVKWRPAAVAAPDGAPVIAVLPMEIVSGRDMGGDLESRESREKPPFLLRLGSTRWETLQEGDFLFLENPDAGLLDSARGASEVWLAATPEGSLWVANRNAYRLQHVSPLGKVKLELVVGKGKPEWIERTEENWTRLEEIARKEKFPFSRSRLSTVTYKPVVRAMAYGRDGRVYLAVDTPDGLALDRFDPDPNRQVLERVLLQGIEPGNLTMAAGRHALFFAAVEGTQGRWSIGWELLETAKWKPVAEAALKGQEPAPAETTASR